MSTSSHTFNIHKIDVDSAKSTDARCVEDWVAVEEPLEIRLGYETPEGRTATSVSITMRTPGFDAELATGFLYSESIISHARDVLNVEHCGPAAPDSGNHNIIRVDLAANVAVDLGRLQRHFYTTSSCGVCGKSSLDALRVTGAEPMDPSRGKFTREVRADRTKQAAGDGSRQRDDQGVECFDERRAILFGARDTPFPVILPRHITHGRPQP